ncbi:MBL fold metallo-hydrolase [Staphylothermus hellenicus]|uniref:Beta-lactamase domain protein n=1 Tax=Staphylothermus hellenicus (strain DSM 12710 / JCM 10830 / BK20S6-10-b1 / P8) TaxID=591019 RepID=D7D9H2_STAHD|nr:MBL fold metallo-hydrolase [Staphylothermus hellenicus]ADI32418.1 beta-lactamase domain protein [Staphylothermus hellenicus DSM 12710]
MGFSVEMIVLNDNVGRPGLLNDWGWSVYVEVMGEKILFDADTSPEIIRFNTKQLGVDLEKLDYCFLSHHHGDHYGGFEYFADLKRKLKIYVPPGDVDYLKNYNLTPIIIREPAKLSTNTWSTGPLKYGYIYEHGLFIYNEEIDPILIVGCSHPGVDKLAGAVKKITGKDLFLVIGGFHSPPRKVIDNLASITKYICPTHCSGEAAKNYVMKTYPEKYCKARTGSIIKVKDQKIEVTY